MSRLKAIKYLKEFKDKRVRDGSDSGKSDLQILRGRMAPFFVQPLILVAVIFLLDWSEWMPMTYLVIFGIAASVFVVVMLHNRKIRAVVGLFEECGPQSVPEMLAQFGERLPASRSAAVTFMEKFCEDRRKFDAYSPLSDLQALRKLEGISLLPGVLIVALVKQNAFPVWVVVVGGVFFLVSLLYDLRLQRKVRGGLAMFAECTPQTADEVLGRLGDRSGSCYNREPAVPSY